MILAYSVNKVKLLGADMRDLRGVWEATSFQLERRQTNPACVEQEEASMRDRKIPPYSLSFEPTAMTLDQLKALEDKPKVAILREEGSNGDREMTAAFYVSYYYA